MKSIGLTGGIASGKSLVATIFGLYGIPIYNSDQRAKQLIQHNPKVKDQIIKHFGEGSYDLNGNYQTQYISSIVFSNKEKLEELNAIVHPAVHLDQEQWLKSQTTPYAIVESALLVETGQQVNYELVITVAAEDNIRIDRIMKRDGLSQDQAEARLKNQLPQSEKIAVADYVLWNNGDQSLLKQIDQTHRLILGGIQNM